MKNLITLFFLLVIAFTNVYSQNYFEEIIFDQNRVKMNDVKIRSKNAFVAVGQQGVIRRFSEDGDVSVYFRTKEKKELFSVTYVSDSKLFTVGEEGYIYRSLDSGYNWELMNSPTINNLKALVFINDKTGIAVGDKNTIVKTTNGGIHWQQIYIENIGSDFNDITASSNGILYIAGTNSTVLKSIDSGDVWNSCEIQKELNFSHIKAIGENKVYVMGDSLKVIYSNNSGDQWFSPVIDSYYFTKYKRPEITSYFFKNENEGVIEVHDSYDLNFNTYECYTTNGGLNWKKVTMQHNITKPPTPYKVLGMDFAGYEFGVLFDSKADMYKMNYLETIKHTIFKFNLGFDFLQIAHKGNQYVISHESSSQNSGLFTFNDDGKNWIETTKFDNIGINSGHMTIEDVSIPKKDVIILAVNETRDTTWTEGTTTHYRYLYKGYTLKSTDFGKSWKIIMIPNREHARGIDMYSDYYGLMNIGYKNHYMLTKDCGDSWNYIPFPDSANISLITSVKCISPELHLIVAQDSNYNHKVYKIFDEGESGYSDIQLPENHFLFKYINEARMFSFGRTSGPIKGQYSVYINSSTDGGNSWFNVIRDTNKIDNILIDLAEFDNDNFMAYSRKHFYITRNGGETWNIIPLYSIITQHEIYPSDVEYISQNEIIFSTNRSQLFKMNLDNLTIVEITNHNTPHYQVFPNPANDFITILTSEVLETSIGYKVQLFDLLGIEIISESIHPMTGSHRMNIENLPAGVYFIRIGDMVEKFVKM